MHNLQTHHVSTTDAKPPADLHIRSLALRAVEAIQGLRSLDQLGRWVTPSVLASLQQQRRLQAERNTMYRDKRRTVVRPGRISGTALSRSVFEAAIVMHTDHRSFAVVMRFEHLRERWRATELMVL